MRTLIALVSVLHLALALPALEVKAWARGQASDACSTLRDTLQSIAQSGSSLVTEGQLAQDCLAALPFNSDLATEFITQLRKYVEFQSTLEVLKAPPDSYMSPATDILGGLDKISQTKYSSQYEFDFAINSLFNSANDGHFAINLCSLSIFSFNRDSTHRIVSVSTDGLALPALYMETDAPFINSDSVKVSPVTTIDGQKAADFLGNIAKQIGSQDPDTRWNRVFPSYAVLAGGDLTGADGAFINNQGLWPGTNSTVIGFANGTSMTIDVYAKLTGTQFSTSAEGVFEAFCLPSKTSRKRTPTKVSLNEAATATPSTAGPTMYPEPDIRDPYDQIMGFSLDDPDTAVMFIPSFSSSGVPGDESEVFSDTAEKLVRNAQKAGRKRLIIDVSGNGGGEIVRAFNLFRLFFPGAFPYSATRFRRSAGPDLLAQIYAGESQSEAAASGPFGYRGQVKPDQKHRFGTLDDFLGGGTQLGCPVTSLFANFDYAVASSPDDPILGYGPVPLASSAPPYAADDILIVGDGYCASTCTTFVNLMTNVGGVRALAFGGRPAPGPMQIMGGVRGAQSMAYPAIEDTVTTALSLQSEQGNLLSDDEAAKANETLPIPLASFPLVLEWGNVNFRNAYQEGDDDLPLQFQYQAADCRLFYTYENIRNPKTMWQAARDAIWGNKGCVEGSTGAKGSRHPNSTHPDGGSGDKKKNGAHSQHAHGALGGAMLVILLCSLL